MNTMLAASRAALVALTALLAVYFSVLSLVSGWEFTQQEFLRYWPFIVALAAGFGIQVGLFVTLRRLVGADKAQGKVVAVSGTASTAAMVSCCTHYLVNLLPVIGATGLVVFVAQYQVELFWVGLVFNAAGIAYIGTKVAAASREHAKCLATA